MDSDKFCNIYNIIIIIIIINNDNNNNNNNNNNNKTRQLLDSDGSGGLDSDEFCAAVRKLVRTGNVYYMYVCMYVCI